LRACLKGFEANKGKMAPILEVYYEARKYNILIEHPVQKELEARR